MMTRKHFEAIAGIISSHMGRMLQLKDCRAVPMVEALADYMQTENPNFDRSKFLVACYKSS
jgi:hypothetical protein